MRVAIMGAGAVGCYHGAMLALAGHEVVLIGRPALADAVAARGLILEKGRRQQAVALRAGTDPALVAGADLVLICVKAQDNAAVAAAMQPHLPHAAPVLSLQNGLGNAAQLSRLLGRPVLPAVVYVAVQMGGPGHVVHHGRGELVLGTGPAAAEVAAVLTRAEIPTHVSDRTDVALWTKLVVNCALNPVSAVTRQPYGRIFADAGAVNLLRGVVAECQTVAQAEGIELPADIWAQIAGIAAAMPDQISSTAQDVLRGRRTEIDHLNGEILRRAAQHGLAVPLNAALVSLVRLIEPST